MSQSSVDHIHIFIFQKESLQGTLISPPKKNYSDVSRQLRSWHNKMKTIYLVVLCVVACVTMVTTQRLVCYLDDSMCRQLIEQVISSRRHFFKLARARVIAIFHKKQVTELLIWTISILICVLISFTHLLPTSPKTVLFSVQQKYLTTNC
jgi:hypothetical protein